MVSELQERVADAVEDACVAYAADRYAGTGLFGEQAAKRIWQLFTAAGVKLPPWQDEEGEARPPDKQWLQLGRDPTGVGLVAKDDLSLVWSRLVGCRVRQRNDGTVLGRLLEISNRGQFRAHIRTLPGLGPQWCCYAGTIELDPVYLEVEV